MKLTCIVVLIVAGLAFGAPSGPCNPAIAYHGSECNCESKLPYVVQTAEVQAPQAQYQSYQFAIRYPVKPQGDAMSRPSQVYDAQVQQVQPNPDQKLRSYGYEIRAPAVEKQSQTRPRYDYTVQLPQEKPQGAVQLKNLDSCVDRLDLPRECKCQSGGPCTCNPGSPCSCHKTHQPRLRNEFAPMDFQQVADLTRYNQQLLRVKRSPVKDDLPVGELKPQKSKKVKSLKSHKAEQPRDVMVDDDNTKITGDTYVLERIKRQMPCMNCASWNGEMCANCRNQQQKPRNYDQSRPQYREVIRPDGTAVIYDQLGHQYQGQLDGGLRLMAPSQMPAQEIVGRPRNAEDFRFIEESIDSNPTFAKVANRESGELAAGPIEQQLDFFRYMQELNKASRKN